MKMFIKQIYQQGSNKERPAFFLDRDGTIIRQVEYLFKKTDIKILPGIIKALRQLKKKKYLLIIVTNQPVVARGYTNINGVMEINNYLYQLLARNGIFIDAVYSCPHHPNGNVKEFCIKCNCRKPGLAMFNDAIEEFNINLLSSFMAGDRTGDIKAGQNLGIKTILLETGFSGKDSKYQINPDFKLKSLDKAVTRLFT